MPGSYPAITSRLMSFKAEVEYAQTEDGLSIAYAVFGSGPLDLLFVPGFVSHLGLMLEGDISRPFWERLGAFARVIAFDKRGQGLSDAGPYTLEGITADAIAVLDAAGVEEAAVFGISEGGPAATMMAATHPERLSRMVQFGTYARLARANDYAEGFAPEDLERTEARMREQWGDPGLLKLWAPTLADDPGVRDWWTKLLRWGAGPSVANTIWKMYREMDVRPLLPLVRVPTLILWREDDHLVPPAFSRAVAEGIPGAQGKCLPGADHLVFAGDTDELLDEVEQFLTGQTTSRPVRRVLSTVLFTDLVDSTRLAAEMGDRRWRDLLEESLKRWRGAVEAGRGRFVKSTGDGLLATFDGPAQAVRVAVEMRERAQSLGLETRSGIHTGECELVGDDDVAGIAVHIASRAESMGEPGEVTTTGTVKDLVIGSGLEFEPRGVHELKGVPGEWPLFAVVADAEGAGP
jgi:pimeloyl-ACP methyl ester carboxylesterase